MKFYAVLVRFSNVERTFRFDTRAERDAWVEDARETPRRALTRRELDARLARNRQIVRGNRKDSGWVNGLPENMSEIEEGSR